MSDTPQPFKPVPGSRIPGYKPAPGSRFPQKDKELLKLEAYMVQRINDERRLLDLPLLTQDPLLSAVARAHSEEMRVLGYFDHDSPTAHLRTISNRYYLAYGLTPQLLAENIAYASGAGQAWFGPDDLLEKSVRQWIDRPLRATKQDIERSHTGLMNSPGHRANILLTDVIYAGVGIIFQDGKMWVTQMFSRP